MWNSTTALNTTEINISENTPPEWVELIPSGEVVGRDGRRWVNNNPLSVVQFFVATGLELPVDVEHSTELKAPKGDEAPAVGWVIELKVIGGAVWGRIKWNHSGHELISTRQYRYLSPAIRCGKSNREIVALSSVGLTNTPNLILPALNSQVGPNNQEVVNGLTETERTICSMMGVSIEEYLNTIHEEMKAQQTSSALNATEQTICSMMGITEGEYLQAVLREQMEGAR
ncbi:MAG: phage protease [Desulfobulbus sp.]|nr:phage protease [Desulfobulbus sp.]